MTPPVYATFAAGKKLKAVVGEVGSEYHKYHLHAYCAANEFVPLNWKFFVAALKDWDWELLFYVEINKQDHTSCVQHGADHHVYRWLVNVLRERLMFLEGWEQNQNQLWHVVYNWDYQRYHENQSIRKHVLWQPVFAVVLPVREYNLGLKSVVTIVEVWIE